MAAKKFKVKYDGIDGKSIKSFATLAEAGKYLSERYQGADYLSGSGVMGTDYAKYVLVGFNLNDVGKFDYSEGYPEYEFYDWSGGKLVDMSKPVQVYLIATAEEHEDVIYDKGSFESEAEAVDFAKGIKVEPYSYVKVSSGGKLIGYNNQDGWISAEDWYKEHPYLAAVDNVPVESSEPPPF